METIQEQARDARINSLLDELGSTDDSAEAVLKARELKHLVSGDVSVSSAVGSHHAVAEGTTVERLLISREVHSELLNTRRWLFLSLASSVCMVAGSLGFGFLSWTNKNLWLLLVPLVVVPTVVWVEVRLERSIHKLTQEFRKREVSRTLPSEN